MKHYLCIIVVLLSSLTAFSQTKTLQLDPDFSPQINVTGTSSLHDWKVTSSSIADMPVNITLDPQAGIPAFEFKVPVDSLDGGRGPSMNAKIKTAFKSSQHPHIIFKQTEPAFITTADGKMTIVSTGNLSMAGAEQTVSVTFTGERVDNLVTFKGSQKLKMSDFGMTPPTAMFGQIKTRDDVVVNFEFKYKVNP